MKSTERIKKSMRNAEASLNMENLYVSDKDKELCFRLLNKEITFDEYLAAIRMKAVPACPTK